MALRQWELEPEQRPDLALASPPPPRRRPVAAASFALLLVAALSAPVVQAALDRPAVPVERPRALPGSSVGSLDSLQPLPKVRTPRSRRPVGGLAFVRCTRLWTALPDGSRPHSIVDLPGISSPTFSPDARSIAFLAATEAGGELWVAGADGSSVKRIGALTAEGWPIAAQATGLTWSPDGRRLGLALRDTDYGPFEGGSTLWELELATGRFTRLGYGWPQPFWIDRKLVYARWDSEAGEPRFHGARAVDRLSRRAPAMSADMTAGLGWFAVPAHEIAVLREADGGKLELHLRRSRYSNGPGRVVRPPAHHEIPDYARPTLSQAGSRISISLVAPDGAPEIGVYDSARRDWTILPYAWQPSASPAPEVFGRPSKQRALEATDGLLANWNDGGFTTSLLMGRRRDRALIPFDDMQFTMGDPARKGAAWLVPATVYGARDGAFESREVDVRVTAVDGRMVARPASVSPVRPIESVDDAVSFLRDTLTVPVPAPGYLPEGTTLSTDRNYWPVGAWTNGSRTSGTLNLTLADGGRLTIDYGRAYFHSCGEFEGLPVEVEGQPALLGADGAGAHQVLWPATRESYDENGAPLSVYGQLPKEEVFSIAESMEP